MEKTKKLPNQSIDFEFGGNNYTINFPNNGQFIDIEKTKAQLTNGYYGEMKSGSGNSYYATMIVDMIATFSVLCKDLIKDLNKDVLKITLIESKPLVDIYQKKYLPWFNEWSNILAEVDLEEEKTED